jgi:hypothetical protein
MRTNIRWKQIGVTALIYLGLVVALAAIGAGVFFGGKSYLDGVDARGFDRGQKEAQTAYLARDNKALAAATQRIRELQERVRATEAEAAAGVATIDAAHDKELANVKERNERDVAAARSGALRLRDRWRNEARACTAERVRDSDRAIAGTTSGSNEEAGGEFSPEATEFLLGEANRADAIVEQLGAAQAIINKYLETVNGRN